MPDQGEQKRDVLNCCSKMPGLRKARLSGFCNLLEELGMSHSRRPLRRTTAGNLVSA